LMNGRSYLKKLATLLIIFGSCHSSKFLSKKN
jgi:hypothetical protein